MIRKAISSALLATSLLLLVSCEDEELLNRIDSLEAELAELKSSTLSEVENSTGDLERRVALLEKDALAGETLAAEQEERFRQIEQTFSDALNKREDKKVYLPVGNLANKILETKLGSFLVKFEGFHEDPVTGKLRARLRLGNPNPVSFREFTLSGDYGDLVPELEPGEKYDSYSKRVEAWERGLTPFREIMVQDISPNSWNLLEVPLPAAPDDQHEMIRFSLSLGNVRFVIDPSSESSSSAAFAELRVDRNSASVLETEYGGFLIAPIGEPEASGTGNYVPVKIGNPTGLSVGRSRLIGQYGSAPPDREEGESLEDYNLRASSWKTTLQNFEAPVAGPLRSGKWTPTRFLVPEKDPSEMRYFRVKLIIENVSFP